MYRKQASDGMYILTKEDFEAIATEQLQEYDPSLLWDPHPLDIDNFMCDYLGMIIKDRYIGDIKSGILGLTVMGDITLIPSYDDKMQPIILEETFGTTLLSPILLGPKNIPRRRYTAAHEASHFILHQPYYSNLQSKIKGNNNYLDSFATCHNAKSSTDLNNKNGNWLEYQAEALASALLMPRTAFISCVQDTLFTNGYDLRQLSDEEVFCDSNVQRMIYDIANTFGVSFRAVKNRMRNLGLIPKYNTVIKNKDGLGG